MDMTNRMECNGGSEKKKGEEEEEEERKGAVGIPTRRKTMTPTAPLPRVRGEIWEVEARFSLERIL